MADKTSTLRVQLVDELSGKAKRAAEAILGVGKAVDAAGRKRANLFGMDPSAMRDVRSTMQFQERMVRQRTAAEISASRAAEASRRRLLSLEHEISAVAAKRHAAIIKANKEAAKLAQQNSLMARAGRGFETASAVGAGVVAGGAVLGRPLSKAMTFDQQITYMAATMAGGGSQADMKAAKGKIGTAINAALKAGGGKREDAATALNTLVASGQFGDQGALDALPSVVKTAHAAGASAEDIAKTAVAMKTAGVAIEDIQKGFDYLLRAGQLGSFELPNMARWMPQQLAMARAAGFQGLDAIRQMASYNQIMMRTAGTPDEAGNNMVNLLQKLNSRELQDTLAKQVKPEAGDPTTPGKVTGKGKKAKRAPAEFDWQGYMIQQQKKGVNPIEALNLLLERQLAGNERYQDIKKQIAAAKTDEERGLLLDRAAKIAEGAEVGKFLADRQALLALLAVTHGKAEKAALDKEIAKAHGATEANSQFVRGETWSKAQDGQNAIDRMNKDSYDAISGPLGSVLTGLTDVANKLPGLSAALYGATVALTAVAAGRIVGGLVTGGSGAAAGAAASSVPRFASSATPRMFTSGDLARAQAGGRFGIGAGAAGSSLMGKIGAGLKGGLINGAVYGLGAYGIDKILGALPKPAYPPGYDPKAEADKGLITRVQELVGLKERYEPPKGWREGPARQKRIDDAWSGGTTTEANRPTPAGAPSPDLGPTAPLPPIRPPEISSGAEQAKAVAMATGQAFVQAMLVELSKADAAVSQQVAALVAKLSFTATPTIRPRLDASAIRGVHADTGVD